MILKIDLVRGDKMRVQLVSDTELVLLQAKVNAEVSGLENINQKVVDIRLSTCSFSFGEKIMYTSMIIYEEIKK